MLFWIAAALLTLGACLSVLAPLARPSSAAAVRRREHDIEVYRDQLAELERDAARGVIDAAEAEEARAELGRRILRAAAENTASAPSSAPAAVRWTGLAAVLAVPLVAWGVYWSVGSPDLPPQPLQARLSKEPAESSIAELVARAESHLAANPSDAQGWDVLAPIYLRMGRFADAVTAYRNAIRLDGSSAAREAGLGEALAAEAGGIVTADAQAAFQRAVALDPKDARSRFFLATAMAQERRYPEAAEAWKAMIADLPPDSPWRGAAERASAQALAAVERLAGRGPSQAEIEAADQISEADRGEMIRAMVASLDRRLREAPSDVEAWKRLVRSYLVLGENEQARDALKRGVAALGETSAEAEGLSAFATSLGLTATE